MNRPKAAGLFSVVCTVVIAVSGCGGADSDSQDAGETQTAIQSTPTAETVPHMPPAATPAEPQSGISTEAAETTAERFLAGWATFVPWDFDPASAWFGRWEHLASPAFIGRMQLSVNDMWSWTWNEQKKAFDARVEGAPTTWIEGERAVTRMTINRLVMRVDARVNEFEEQRLTFDVSMVLAPESRPVVVDVQATHPAAPAPDLS